MKIITKIIVVGIFLCLFRTAKAQGTLPIYSDYLSDNVFLLHPSAAGIGNCAKLRATYRNQWLGEGNSPSLQTLSYHQRFGEKTALGAVLFNDKNGFHSQKGAQLTYAYHVDLENGRNTNQLSFAIAGSFVQNSVDQTGFISPDPVISQIVESDSYFNADFSAAYHYTDAFAYFTIKNLLLNSQSNGVREFESLNLRRYLLNFGYYLGREREFQFEPSVMFQFIEYSGEKSIDLNFKAYKVLKEKQSIWAALSYRRSFDGDVVQNLSQLTPVLGFNHKNFMVSYTYTSELGAVNFGGGGQHQITLGINLFCQKPRATGCPNLNTIF